MQLRKTKIKTLQDAIEMEIVAFEDWHLEHRTKENIGSEVKGIS